jgi:hypothetical protein
VQILENVYKKLNKNSENTCFVNFRSIEPKQDECLVKTAVQQSKQKNRKLRTLLLK